MTLENRRLAPARFSLGVRQSSTRPLGGGYWARDVAAERGVGTRGLRSLASGRLRPPARLLPHERRSRHRALLAVRRLQPCALPRTRWPPRLARRDSGELRAFRTVVRPAVETDFGSHSVANSSAPNSSAESSGRRSKGGERSNSGARCAAGSHLRCFCRQSPTQTSRSRTPNGTSARRRRGRRRPDAIKLPCFSPGAMVDGWSTSVAVPARLGARPARMPSVSRAVPLATPTHGRVASVRSSSPSLAARRTRSGPVDSAIRDASSIPSRSRSSTEAPGSCLRIAAPRVRRLHPCPAG